VTHFREDLAKVAEQTQKILERGFYQIHDTNIVSIQSRTEHAIRNAKLYRPEDLQPFRTHFSNYFNTTIETTGETTLAACKRLTEEGHQVIALNFASARTPGGGWLGGAPAQEESLARASALVPTISQFQEMYRHNDNLRSALYSDYMIYSPEVPVFRDDTHKLLEKPYTVSFITSPAPNAGAILKNAPQDRDKIGGVMTQRIEKILRLAKLEGYDTIVLGAFGCGVFQNNPDTVAHEFKRQLSGSEFGNQFKHVVFAVYDRSPNQLIYKIFKNILG
jgi:uncharacterized protein (TIGR02452 family)